MNRRIGYLAVAGTLLGCATLDKEEKEALKIEFLELTAIQTDAYIEVSEDNEEKNNLKLKGMIDDAKAKLTAPRPVVTLGGVDFETDSAGVFAEFLKGYIEDRKRITDEITAIRNELRIDQPETRLDVAERKISEDKNYVEGIAPIVSNNESAIRKINDENLSELTRDLEYLTHRSHPLDKEFKKIFTSYNDDNQSIYIEKLEHLADDPRYTPSYVLGELKDSKTLEPEKFDQLVKAWYALEVETMYFEYEYKRDKARMDGDRQGRLDAKAALDTGMRIRNSEFVPYIGRKEREAIFDEVKSR